VSVRGRWVNGDDRAMKYHEYKPGDVVGFYGNAFNNQGRSITDGVIVNHRNGEYNIEADGFFYWRTPEELHQWVNDHMIDVVSQLNSI